MDKLSRKKLKEHVGKGRIIETINTLKESLETKTGKINIYNDLVILEYQYNSLSKKEKTGVLSEDENQIGSNKVAKGVLEILDNITDEDLNGNNIKNVDAPDSVEIELKLSANIKSSKKIRELFSTIEDLADDYSIKYRRIRRGSTIISFEITEDGYHTLMESFNSGKLSEALGHKILGLKKVENQTDKKSKAINIKPSAIRRKKIYLRKPFVSDNQKKGKETKLASTISARIDISEVDVSVILESFFEEVKNSLSGGENVYIRGFGSFMIKKRKIKKNGLGNPRMITIDLPSMKNMGTENSEYFIPAFKPAKSFIEQVKYGRSNATEGEEK